MSSEAIIAVLASIIILLFGAHYGSLIYRLHKLEDKYDALQNRFSDGALAVANAAVIAAQSAASALKK